MAPPESLVTHTPPEQDILVICQDLHMSFSGSFVDWTRDEIERHIVTIKRRVENWRPAVGRWAAFDGAVYAVCCATLAEAEEWRRDSAQPTAPWTTVSDRNASQSTLERKNLRFLAGANETTPRVGDVDVEAQSAGPDNREAWQYTAEEDMGLRVSRPSPHHVQFRSAESGRVEADWWPSSGRLKIHGLGGGATGTWTDVRNGERVLHLLRQM